ncbi:EAL domain-containing protein [Novosphingobium aerophilum]|uniref:bifunctional diguanylate cyclase/phosphodiesterase n=1 Tax=Novosphingobium TaxID=165696 RepID=UPI0006C8588C|nr:MULTISPECIES: bifunctional diguanylate cyclase/phosphodiesterase [unclassified Novosphingobium]KPH66375.1 diguanylate cyclase [Novosphingobium sp. ST904]MPS70523.1 GGDEF domain-containing protein [Novosphingobium sp.]TCM30012.1 EAL domain-containing protein (putative c-di-GMP-specific phosphodiesterase class I) [Novosphingobium sp. ST904]WRT94562.1 bifunctional diguanylate cyclase/phosphodiesterase [Novosphingobium sp. RL4]
MVERRKGRPQRHARRLEDRLTGIPGLDAVRERIDAWRADAESAPQHAHVHAMLLALRRLDAINMAYGETAGDGALEEVANRVAHFAGEELDGPWLLARAGGGSFVLVANEACSRERWQLVADQLADAIARPIALPTGVLRLSPRIALIRALTEESVDSMLDRLGHALHDAQDQTATRLGWADGEVTPPGRSAAQLEADLLGAIDRDEIEILFQPQFSLIDDSLTGAEALARWNHPQLGRIGAGALFAIAERADHIGPLSRHIAAKALAAAGGWPGNLRLSINVTPADLAFGTYVRQMLDLIRESGFPPRRLTLEITEQSLIADVTQTAQMMAEFSSQGIRIALDDFGAGFCNFRYLKVLPIHYLKLDRAMIDGITTDKRDVAVLRAIVAMAKALDLEVIAEGIEEEAQRKVVAREHCAYYQGFLRAQPMSTAMFAKLARVEA